MTKKYMTNKYSHFYIVENETGKIIYDSNCLIHIRAKLKEPGILTKKELLNLKKYGFFEQFKFWKNYKSEKCGYDIDIWKIEFEKYTLEEEQPLR